ncbi:MAG: ATP-binding protein, partial [Ignavibacteriae bacterium]|nr:ATP-binding protein [Ignavibacteriota bacterium]
NAGTWFIGRLQTDRDRMRVLDGLEGATLEGGGKFDRAQIDRLLSNLDKRVFLLHNVNEPHPVIFNTRWAMSYLRGPLTRTQIKDLMNTEKPSAPSIIADTTSVSVDSINVSSLPKSIKPLFFKREIAETDIASTQFKPYLIAQADIRFYDRTKKIDLQKTAKFLVPITKEVISVKWNEGYEADFDENLLQKNSTLNLPFAELPAAAKNEKNFSTWENFFEDYLTNEYYLEVYSSSELKETSKPNESVRDFKIRLSQITREQRDSEMEKLKDSYQRKIKTIESRIQRAQEKIEREKSQSTQVKLQTAISVGSTILGALFGRKKISTSTISKAGTAMKSAGRAMKESGDVSRAEESLELLNQQMTELQDKLQDDLNLLQDKFDLSVEQLETVKIRPKKTNISIKLFSFLWIPLADEGINSIPEVKII